MGHTILALAHHEAAAATFRVVGMEAHPRNLLQLQLVSLQEAAGNADGVCHVGFPKSEDFLKALEQDRQAAHATLAALKGTGKPFVFTSGGMFVIETLVGTTSDRVVVTEDMPVVERWLVAYRGGSTDRNRPETLPMDATGTKGAMT